MPQEVSCGDLVVDRITETYSSFSFVGAGLSFLFEIPAPGKEDVEFDLLDIEKVVIGNPFFIQVEMANRVGSLRTVTLSLNANSFYQTGILAKKIKNERHIIRLKPYQST